MEENTILEQPVIEKEQPLTDGKSDENNTANFLDGSKFKSVEDLFNAYNNLESEFTKKCQTLKELQKTEICDNDSKSPQTTVQEEKENASRTEQTSQLIEIMKEQSNKIDSQLNDEKMAKDDEQQVIDEYIAGNEKLKKYIVEQYLSSLSSSMPPTIINATKGSAIATSEPKVANNLNEAKQLVRQLLEQQ